MSKVLPSSITSCKKCPYIRLAVTNTGKYRRITGHCELSSFDPSLKPTILIDVRISNKNFSEEYPEILEKELQIPDWCQLLDSDEAVKHF